MIKCDVLLKLMSVSSYLVSVLLTFHNCLTLKVPEKLPLYGLYVYYVVHICDFGTLRVNDVKHLRNEKRKITHPPFFLKASYTVHPLQFIDRRDGLVDRAPALRSGGHRFKPQLGHTKVTDLKMIPTAFLSGARRSKNGVG